MLDFFSKKLSLPQTNDDIKKVYKSLSDIGNGDLIWDDRFILTRKSKIVVENSDMDSLRLKETTDYYQLLELSPEMKFPISMEIKTKESKKFKIKLLSIKSDGIWISILK